MISLRRWASRLTALSSVMVALTGCVDAAEPTTTTATDPTSTTEASTSLPSTTLRSTTTTSTGAEPDVPGALPTLEDAPETIDEGLQRLGEIGTLRALTAEIVDGSCAPITGHDEDEPAPIGSIFKLYVLAALGDAIESGEVSWSDEMVIRDELKSEPSGTLQTMEAGDVVTVHEAAGLMISISDNTATDHLMDLLGRGTVEMTMAAYGHTSPDLNIPFMNTREFTALKVGPASGLRIQWIEGDEEARRSILRQISGITTGDLPVQDWTSPIDPHIVEWFASPQDLCRLAAGLLDLSASVPEIAEILAAKPGVPAEPGTW